MKQVEEKTHAKMSPSSSPRWMHCAGSIEINAGTGKRASKYAEEGTAAHELFEMCHRIDVDPEKFLGKCLYKDFEVTEEMAEAVSLALDWIVSYQARNKKAKIFIEHEVDPYPIIKCPPGLTSGTLDIGADNAPDELVVLDYKHGAGVVVEVMDNTQLLQYLLGLYAKRGTRPYKRYRTVIVQPRARHEEGPVREHVYTHQELMDYADRLRKRVKQIRADPHHREAGKWCTFCAGAGRCKTLAEYNLKTAMVEFGGKKGPPDPRGLDDDELADIMARLPIFEKWMKAVYAAAFEFMMKGGYLKGQKLVQGRSTRSWSSEKRVKGILVKNGFDENEFAPRELLGVAKIAQLIKRRIAVKKLNRKEKKEIFDKAWERTFHPLVNFSEKQLHVAPTSDPREEVVRGEEFLDAPVGKRRKK